MSPWLGSYINAQQVQDQSRKRRARLKSQEDIKRERCRYWQRYASSGIDTAKMHVGLGLITEHTRRNVEHIRRNGNEPRGYVRRDHGNFAPMDGVRRGSSRRGEGGRVLWLPEDWRMLSLGNAKQLLHQTYQKQDLNNSPAMISPYTVTGARPRIHLPMNGSI